MRTLCFACHSSSIAALIYIIAVPDMHGQKVDTENYQSPHVNLYAIAIDEQRLAFERSLWRRSKFKHFNTAVLSIVPTANSILRVPMRSPPRHHAI